MNRRNALKYLFITGASVWVFPACTNEQESTDRYLNTSLEELLEDISEAVIPSITTPGSKELGIKHFIQRMIKDCRSPEYQQSFRSGLEKFDAFVKQRGGKKWSNYNRSEKEGLLADIIKDKHADKHIQTCIKGIRELTISGYRNSKYFLTDIRKYQAVPGHFYGSVQLNKRDF